MAETQEADRPRAPGVDAGKIPDALKARDRWVGWKFAWRDEKWTKLPVHCATGRAASTAMNGAYPSQHAGYRSRPDESERSPVLTR